MDRLRVVLADDHALFRAGLCALLDYSDDIEVVGEAQNGREAVELAEALQPDVVVMDIAMPVMNGIEATATICERAPEVKVLVLTERVRIRGVYSQFRGSNIARNGWRVENGIRCPEGGSYPPPSESTIS